VERVSRENSLNFSEKKLFFWKVREIWGLLPKKGGREGVTLSPFFWN
jgi:hypothetical protein